MTNYQKYVSFGCNDITMKMILNKSESLDKISTEAINKSQSNDTRSDEMYQYKDTDDDFTNLRFNIFENENS